MVAAMLQNASMLSLRFALLPAAAIVAVNCSSAPDAVDPPAIVTNCSEASTCYTLTRRFPTTAQPTPAFTGCVLASPLLHSPAGGASAERVIVADGKGTISAIVADTGALDWSVRLPAPDGEDPFVVATPVLVGARLVVAYHTTPAKDAGPHVTDPRLRHRVAVVDLDAKQIDPSFPVFDLSASAPATDGTVAFVPAHALGRSALVHAVPAGSTLGHVYATYGNARDLQPWHGWAFEIDLDAWKAGKSPIAAALLTTAEADCGPENGDGARQRRCGGGLWSPAGPLVIPRTDGYDIVLSPGNGQLDLAHGDFANTLMRTGPGLQFEHGCDAAACANFNADDPAAACIASCSNLYVPRLMSGEAVARPENGACDGLTTLQCWERVDFADGSTPVHVRLPSGRGVLAYATKDGMISLIDADHMGTLYDRKRLVDLCGTKTDACEIDWAGMIVTQPAVIEGGGDPILAVPTFMPDRTHAAGVIGVRIYEEKGHEENGAPQLAIAWRVGDDVTRNRVHPSLPRVAAPFAGDAPFVLVVEPDPKHTRGGVGRLVAIRGTDGWTAAEAPLAGPGQRFVRPLVRGTTVYVPSCDSDAGPAHLEAYDFERTAR
jgi:hypothetical protein